MKKIYKEFLFNKYEGREGFLSFVKFPPDKGVSKGDIIGLAIKRRLKSGKEKTYSIQYFTEREAIDVATALLTAVSHSIYLRSFGKLKD